jgi:hypothetical protein
MKLRKMRRLVDGEWDESVCALANTHGGEFTVCGDDAVCDVREGPYTGEIIMEPIGDDFEGKLKDVTCRDCLSVISFIKAFR